MSKKLIFNALKEIEFGCLKLIEKDGSLINFSGTKNGPNADIKINDENLFKYIISGGDIAFGEGYINKLWETSDLTELLKFFAFNSAKLEEFFHARKIQTFFLILKNFFTKNTITGSKKNIKAHYDLGNNFYQIWLDDSMTYSSAFFNDSNISLLEAQKQKYQYIISKLNHGNILEIGCGWGGFAIEAAVKNNLQTKCLTISAKQKEFLDNKINELGISNLISVQLQDYRNENSKYDNIVSIEMFEAVGKEYWKKYFNVINNSLLEAGKAILQIITIDEQVYDDYINRVDFIQKHIFPGGVLPSKSIIRKLAADANFTIKSELNLGKDYSKTLEIWLKNFDENYTKIKSLGLSDEFIRKWRFYLCYCISGFESKRTDVVVFELQKTRS